jgi:hypothetical protein
MKSVAKGAAKPGEDLLWKIAESDEVEIETRRDAKSPLHRVTIWIVPTEEGVYVRSYKGKRGRWYQEAVANPLVSIRLGRRQVKARAEPEHSPLLIRAVNVAYRKKYGERWPEETQAMLKRSLLPTTLRVTPV